MGRELGINRIDFLKDGTAVIRHSDYNLCGRTDFTGDISNLFYLPEKSVQFLLVAADDYPDADELTKIDKVHVKVEDDYWDEKEFDLEYAMVHRSRIKEICDERAEEDDRELARELAMMEDARIARQHATTLKDFEDFSELLDTLQEHYNSYNEEARDYWNEFRKIENTLGGRKAWGLADNAPEDVAQSWILLTYSE